jgi:hypothetical protein
VITAEVELHICAEEGGGGDEAEESVLGASVESIVVVVKWVGDVAVTALNICAEGEEEEEREEQEQEQEVCV